MKIRAVHNMMLIWPLAIGLVCGFLYFQGPNEAYGANLITDNPGFETDDGGGDPANWTEWPDDTLGSRDTTTYRQGGVASAKLQPGATANSGNLFYQSFSASVNQIYVASVYIRSLSTDALAGGAEAFLKLEFKDSSYAVIAYYESIHLSSSNSGWERHTVVGIAPPTTTTVQFNCGVWTAVAGATGSAYFDDADLHLVTAPAFRNSSNYFLNNSFSFEVGGGTSTPTGWGVWGGTWVEPAATGAVRTGSYSMKLWTDGTSGNTSGCYKNFPVQGGQLVELSVYATSLAGDPLAGNAIAYCKIEWYKKDGSTVAGDALNVERSSTQTGTFGWTQLSVIGVAPPQTGTDGVDQTFFGRAGVIIHNDGGAGSGSVYFDDIEIKVFSGSGQKTVASTPNVVGSSGFSLTFDEGWGGNISSYYDNNVGTGTYHMISDSNETHDLFDINYRQGASEWAAPAKNRYGRLTVVEQSPARTVMQAYAKAMKTDKTSPTASDYWTITYTVYPDGRVFVTESVTVGSVAFGDGPYWAITEEYVSATPTFLDGGTNDTNRQGAILTGAESGLRDAAMWLYETGSSDVRANVGDPMKGVLDSAQDRTHVELAGASAQFTASSTHTHHWMLDLSEAIQSQTILDAKGSDYKTHVSGSDITFDTGSLVTGINSDTSTVDGYDEGAGCWNVLVSSNNLEFILNAFDQTVKRHKPAFFITGYTDTQLPGIVKVDAVAKEQGTDYNIAFVPFSRIYKRYASAQSYSTIYAEGFNDKTATITVNNPDYPVNVTTTDYASWKVNTEVPGAPPSATAGVMDVWGFDLGSRRDIDSATVYATYYAAASSGTADTNNIYGFITDFDQDGSFGESAPNEIIVSTANTAAADTTGSLAIPAANLTDTLLRKLEVRAYTDLVSSNAPTYQAAGTASASISNVTPAYPSGLANQDLILLQVAVTDTSNTPITPAGFTLLYGPDATTTARQWVYYKISDGTETGTITVSIGGDTSTRIACMYSFRGVATSSFTEGGGFGSGTASPVADVSTTTTDDNRLAVSFVFRADDAPAADAFTGMTGGTWAEQAENISALGNPDVNIQLQTATMASAGTIDGGTDVIAPADPWGVRGFALIPAKTNKICYLKNAYISGTYYADDITDNAAAFNTSTEVFTADNDYLYVGSLYKFSGILVDLNTAASDAVTPTFEYYDSGTGWTILTVTDNTSGFMKDGMITFTAPANWTTWNKHDATRYIGGDFYGESLYYVRIKRTADSVTTPPTLRGLATNNLIFQYMSDVDNTNTHFSLVGATLVDLLSFDAMGYFGKVKLSWKTESEYNNIGFNILRSEDAKNYVKINNEIIPGLGTSVIGHEYAYEDTGVTDGETYYYLLEDVESGGKLTKHGPVAAHPGADFDNDGMTDDWEYYYGLPATVADANVDSDDDNLTNLQEFLAGTNPVVIDSENIPGISETSGVKVVESSGLRTVLELNTSVFNAVNKVADGATYQLITLPEYVYGQTADVGKPQIPAKGILLGTASKKPVAINILEYEKDTLAGYNIYPVPKAVLTEDPNDPAIKRLIYEFYKDTNAYAIDAFYPGKLADVDYSNYLQDQQVIKVSFYPIQFNPVRGTLEFYKKIKLEVLQEGADLEAVAAVTPKTALPLTAATAYKVYINENGIYRLTRPYLESQGISLSGVDPRNLKIYNLGAEIPVYVSGEGDGQFGDSDYIEFYGQAVDTRYTGTNVYWLVLSDEPGLRMSASGQVEDATVTPGSFLETYKGEDNTLYWMEATGEDHWFIDAIYGSQVYNLTLNLNGVANSADEATIKIALQGSVYSGAAFTHHVYARLNGYPIADVTWQGATDYIINSMISQSYLNEGANTVTLEGGADPTGCEEILVNRVEVSYRRNFTAKDNALAFGNYTGGAYKYQISGFTDQDVEAYDITDPKNVQRITQLTVLPEDGVFTASFMDIGSKDYIVLTQDKAKVPAGFVRDEPSDLADKKNRVDYIIITHQDFYDTILPFADYRSKQGLKVKVVKLGDIYDEFNYGIADVNAVKDFLKYAYDNWIGPRPAYVLLAGDATYDYRDYSGYGFTDYVPTYMVHSLTFGETGSDNWFVCFDGENDLIPDMLIGRFPVKTTDELEVTIDKIIGYEAISPDEAWTKKMLLVADNDEKIFTDTSEELASYLTKGYTVDKQYLGTTTNSPAALKQGIIDSINEGRLFVNYTGHGGIGLWANERIFTWDDINLLYNRNALPVVTTLTCADGYFVYPRYIESLGERLVNSANGGAIATFVPSGISFPTTQAYLAEGFYGAYFKDGDAILGSMAAKGKLNVYENEPGGDAANVIQTFVLFGDPALRVKMKAPQIPAVAAPAVFDLNKGKVNEIFRLTGETKAAQAAGSSTVMVDKGRKGLTRIVLAEETAPVTLPSEKGLLGSKVPEEKGAGIRGVQLEDKTVVLAPPKWRVLSKAEYGALKAAKPYVNIDYSAIEKGVTDINEYAGQLTELKTKFDKAVKENDLQKASSVFRDITKLARKIYWRTF